MPFLTQYLRSMFEHHPFRLAFILTLACAPLVCALSWMYAGHWAAVEVHTQVTEQTAELELRHGAVAKDFDNALKILRGLPDYLADDDVIVRAVAQHDKAQLDLVSQFLTRYAASFDVDVVFALDASGECLASSNYKLPESFVGQHYADRRYFTEALFEKHGSQFAVGRVTNVPGFFFSSPIFDHGKRVGVMVVKINAPKFERRIRLQNVLVADEQGVVVMAENPKYVFQLMPDAPLLKQPGTFREARYKRVVFDEMPLKPESTFEHPHLYQLDGHLVVMQQQARMEDGFVLYLYAALPTLQDLAQRRNLVFSVSAATGLILVWSLLATLLFFFRARAYHSKIEHSNEELSRLNRVLQQQASHDALTGCLNRRAINDALEREMIRAKRYGLLLSIAMLDIDHFKRINDERGHHVGDQALRHLADQVSMRIRQCDIFARYGGEEFILLMPGTGLDDAVRLLDRIRIEIGRTAVPGVEPPLHMHFSSGVVGHESALTLAELLGKVDAAMYKAKDSGRDCVVAEPVHIANLKSEG